MDVSTQQLERLFGPASLGYGAVAGLAENRQLLVAARLATPT